MIIIKTNESINYMKPKFQSLSSEEQDELYNIILDKEKNANMAYIEEIISEMDSLNNKNHINDFKYGVSCNKCSENYPYAEHKDNFICWSCKNY